MESIRTESEIFDELKCLCQEQGYVNALAQLSSELFIIYEKQLDPDDLKDTKSPNQISHNEISLLTGLMIKNQIVYEPPSQEILLSQLAKTKALLDEYHDAVKPILTAAHPNTYPDQLGKMLKSGKAFREAIFYAGQYAFLFQYLDFSIEKYKNDSDWLILNKGFSIGTARDVFNSIMSLRENKYSALISDYQGGKGRHPSILSVYKFSIVEVAAGAQIGIKEAQSVIAAFSTSSTSSNNSFQSLTDYNEAASYPIIPIDGENFLLFSEYSLAQSIYESPYFWMQQDVSYQVFAGVNKGLFTETFSANRLKHVFGKNRVYENIKIKLNKKEVGEIDVLIIHSDRAIIVEAKSKKLSLAARSGNEDALQSDFSKSIQNACGQAVSSGNFLLDEKYTLESSDGSILSVRRDFSEIFVCTVLSEYYPSLSHQTDQFLKVCPHPIIKHPYVMDVFFLDAMCEMLDTPIQLLNYFKLRTESFGKLISGDELTVLSHHLVHNLYFEDDMSFIHLADDFSVHIDAAMMARRAQGGGDRTPRGILTSFKGTFVNKILEYINTNEDGGLVDLGYFILQMGGASGESFSKACNQIMLKTRINNDLHDFSLGTEHGGITVHSAPHFSKKMMDTLCAHALLKKYSQKSPIWFGLGIRPTKDGEIVCIFGVKSKWTYDKEMEERTKDLSSGQPVNLRQPFSKVKPKMKAGRNEPCPCGSGNKYKKCCI